MCLDVNLNLNLPADVEQRLRDEIKDLDRNARESVLLEYFRRGALSHYELSCALGITRFETDALLKQRGIFEGSPTVEDVERDRRALDDFFGARA